MKRSDPAGVLLNSNPRKKIQFIWPPFLVSSALPLGIPFLVAYLKKKGVGDIEVFDMNIAYWKTMGPHWFSYNLLKRADDILRRRGRQSSPFKKLITQKIFDVLDAMRLEGYKTFPRSLKSLLGSFREDRWSKERDKVKALLSPVLAPDGPAFVCISANYLEQLFFALLIAMEIRKNRGNGVKIVVGGAQVTKNIDYLTASPDVCELIDFFVVDDGEEPLLRLVSDPPESDLSRIPNLYFRDPGRSGTYAHGTERFCLLPSDYSVPDFQGFDFNVYQEGFPLLVSKGCPWGRCTFCNYTGVRERKYYSGSLENTMEIIRGMQKKYNVSLFHFVDDALPSGFLRILATELIRRGMNIRWTTATIINWEFADRDFCRLVKRAGLEFVHFGLESVSPRLLKLMEKYHQNLSPDDIVKIMEVMHGEGLKIFVTVFFGFPTETRLEARQTVDFLLAHVNLIDACHVQVFCLDDSTRVFLEPEKFGITKIYREDKRVNPRLSYYFEAKEGMSQQEASRFTIEAGKELRQAFWKKEALKKEGAH